ITAAIRAYVGDHASVSAKNLTVQTSTSNPQKTTTQMASATLTVGSIGLVGVSVANAKALISGDVEAYIGPETVVDTTVGTLVNANANSTAYAKAEGGSGGAVGIASFSGEAKVSGKTRAWVGEGTTVTTGALTVKASGTNSATNELFALGVGLAGV